MKLVSPLAPGRDQPRRFQHVEVLRDRLTGQAQVVLHRQPGTELEQRLSVSFLQFVENGPTRRCGERLKDIGHGTMIGKSLLACQGGQLRICALGSRFTAIRTWCLGKLTCRPVKCNALIGPSIELLCALHSTRDCPTDPALRWFC